MGIRQKAELGIDGQNRYGVDWKLFFFDKALMRQVLDTFGPCRLELVDRIDRRQYALNLGHEIVVVLLVDGCLKYHITVEFDKILISRYVCISVLRFEYHQLGLRHGDVD